MNTAKDTGRISSRRPKIVISETSLHRIEALAESNRRRNPALAERLLDELTRAKIVQPGKMLKGTVSIGSTVTYRDETSGQEKTVVLVFPEDADIARLRISVMTPIGVALLGLAEGATFYWDTRDHQRRRLTVIRVEQQNAEAGDC